MTIYIDKDEMQYDTSLESTKADESRKIKADVEAWEAKSTKNRITPIPNGQLAITTPRTAQELNQVKWHEKKENAQVKA